MISKAIWFPIWTLGVSEKPPEPAATDLRDQLHCTERSGFLSTHFFLILGKVEIATVGGS